MKKSFYFIMMFLFYPWPSIGADQWSRIYPGNEHDRILSIKETTGGCYLVAGCTNRWDKKNHFWIMRVEQNGNMLWQKAYGDGGNFTNSALSVLPTAEGGCLAACTRPFGAGNEDIQLLKIDAAGDITWQKRLGESGNDSAFCVRQTRDGGYVVAGWTNKTFDALNYDMLVMKLSSRGELSWQKTYGGAGSDQATSIEQTDDGGYIVAGWTYSFGAGECVAWVLRLTGRGEVAWQKNYDAVDAGQAWSVKQGSDGGFIVQSEVLAKDRYEVRALYLTNFGDIERQKQYTGSYMGNFNEAACIRHAAYDGYVIAGKTRQSGALDLNMWLVKLTQDGEVRWQRAYGGSEDDTADLVLQTSDGGYLAAGWTYSFGTGGRSLWLLKLDEQGEIFEPEIVKTEKYQADDRELVSVPARTMTGGAKKVTFSAGAKGQLRIYVSGPFGYCYTFSSEYVRKICDALGRSVSLAEQKAGSAGSITTDLVSIRSGEQKLKVVFRKDPFGNSYISLFLADKPSRRGGEGNSLIFEPGEVRKIISALSPENVRRALDQST